MEKITKLSECALDQAVHVWNEGFQGYFVNVSVTTDQFIKRLVNEGLSPELSLVAWDNEKPIGFILNGIRNILEKRIAWNGGTAVIPAYRQKGIGRQMLKACLDLYREREVDVAYLEAMVQNGPAITLYERCGYQVVDTVTSLVRSGVLSASSFQSESSSWIIKSGLPSEVVTLPFYEAFATWQNQWQSLTGGQSIILYDSTETPVAYALYKQILNDSGGTKSVTLYQCEVAPQFPNQRDVIVSLLNEVYARDEADYSRIALNIPSSNRVLVDILKSEGFSTYADQVSMMRFMGR